MLISYNIINFLLLFNYTIKKTSYLNLKQSIVFGLPSNFKVTQKKFFLEWIIYFILISS